MFVTRHVAIHGHSRSRINNTFNLKVVCSGKMTCMGLYCSLVLVMNIGMCDLVILCLVYPLQEFQGVVVLYHKTSQQEQEHACLYRE